MGWYSGARPIIKTVSLSAVDEIIVATGQRPDLAMTRELRLELDPWLESARALGPMIDPNVHSCGTVDPHGHRETSHPEPGFYTIGIKSYGRAPTFLLLTGYEQARSVVGRARRRFRGGGRYPPRSAGHRGLRHRFRSGWLLWRADAGRNGRVLCGRRCGQRGR